MAFTFLEATYLALECKVYNKYCYAKMQNRCGWAHNLSECKIFILVMITSLS
jgi:hypothetical protein